jgi:hypothetical protein
MISIIDKIKQFKTLLTGWWYSHIPVLSIEKIRAITPYLLGILTLLLLLLLAVGCAAPKTVYVPTKGEDKIIYRDSTIVLRDTIRIPLPVEEKETTTKRDSSHLETSVATSDAWIGEDNTLNHRLRNKNTTLKTKRDTVIVVEYVDKIKTEVLIEEVENPVPYIPKFAWICIIYTCTTVLLLIIIGILKLKRII